MNSWRASLDDFERPPPREIRRNPAVIGEIITSAYKIQRQKCPMLSGTRIMRFVARYGPPSLSPPRPKALVSYSRGWTKDEGKEGGWRSVRGGTMNRRLALLPLSRPLGGRERFDRCSPPPLVSVSRVISSNCGCGWNSCDANALCNSNTTADLNTVSSFPERGIHAAV